MKRVGKLLRRLANALDPEAPTTMHVTVNNAVDPAETAKQIQKMLLRLKRNNGLGGLA